MKGLLILIVVVGVGIWATIQFGFSGMDPAAQAAEFKQKVQPGMSWEQVADYKAPRRFYPINPESMNGEGQPVDFVRENLKNDVAAGGLSSGFKFKYTFSGDEQYEVYFDETGTVASVDPMVTFNDLATGKTWQR